MAGLLMKATESAGTNKFRGVQANIGEVLAFRNMFWAISTAMAANCERKNGIVVPNLSYGAAYRVLAPMVWPRVKQIFEQVVAGGLIQLPSGANDFLNPEIRPYLDRYYRGSGISAEERVKLLKLVWDSILSEFGGRHELYEINYAGNHEAIRLETLKIADAIGDSAKFKSFVDSALSDYDLNGWVNETWMNPKQAVETRHL